jgi:hypothetical protein
LRSDLLCSFPSFSSQDALRQLQFEADVVMQGVKEKAESTLNMFGGRLGTSTAPVQALVTRWTKSLETRLSVLLEALNANWRNPHQSLQEKWNNPEGLTKQSSTTDPLMPPLEVCFPASIVLCFFFVPDRSLSLLSLSTLYSTLLSLSLLSTLFLDLSLIRFFPCPV